MIRIRFTKCKHIEYYNMLWIFTSWEDYRWNPKKVSLRLYRFSIWNISWQENKGSSTDMNCWGHFLPDHKKRANRTFLSEYMVPKKYSRNIFLCNGKYFERRLCKGLTEGLNSSNVKMIEHSVKYTKSSLKLHMFLYLQSLYVIWYGAFLNHADTAGGVRFTKCPYLLLYK